MILHFPLRARVTNYIIVLCFRDSVDADVLGSCVVVRATLGCYLAGVSEAYVVSASSIHVVPCPPGVCHGTRAAVNVRMIAVS